MFWAMFWVMGVERGGTVLGDVLGDSLVDWVERVRNMFWEMVEDGKVMLWIMF